MFYCLLIVNKNGSLIYDKTFTDKVKLTSNEVINIASIFYSMHAISSQLTPKSVEGDSELKLENNGIEVIEATNIKLVCFQTLTKIKFIFVTDKKTSMDMCRSQFNLIYSLYSNVVSKNPFYELDMPIRMEKFDESVTSLFSRR